MRRFKSPEMSCNELVDVITEYLEGTLAAEDVARFEDHLGDCEGCQTYLDQMRETIRALGRLPPESLSPEAERTLITAFHDWRAGG
jgi:predicted anti-sigma-YlaC factor YlaD